MNSRYSALIFTLKNSQVCYASIIQFIQKLDKLFSSSEMHLDGRDLLCLKRAGIGEVYRFFPQSNNVESMMRLVSQSICRENCVTEGVLERMEAYVRNAGTEDFRFILVVDAKSKMDHFEESFQYLLTAWREYSGRIFFCIDNDTGDIRSTQSTYFMVSHYLLFTLLTGNKTHLNTSLNRIINADPQSFYNSIYAWNYLPGQTGRAKQQKSLVHLALNGKLMKLSSFTKFYPVLPIDADTQSILSGSVRSAFQQDWSYKQLREVIEQQPVEVLHLQNAANGYRGISLEMLKAMCLNYLLEADELTEDEEKNAEDKRNLYDDMSMLAFFIYSIYMYFLNKQKVRASLTRDQKLALISDVQDFAVGMLQLVDNTVRHSSTGFGCFSVRIFFAESGRNHSGLPVEYSQYVDKAPDKQYYLEMRLIDSFCPTSDTANQFSADSCIMKTVFLRNLELRSFEAEDAAEQICRFRKKFKSATLSDFFDPKCSNDYPDQFSISDWDTYYDITENTLHHYGLMQFNAILKGHGGYFSVRSGTGYDRNPDCYYDTEGGTGGEAYLPGTQYAVLLPIQLKLQQQYATGFSVPETETDFSSLLYLTEQKCLELPEVVRSLWQACGVNNHAQVSRLISDYLAGNLVSAEKIYTFDFSALQKLDGVDGLNSILAREVFLKGLFHFIKMRFSSQSDCPVLRLAFSHCTHAVLLEIVELFCSFYKRSAKCKEMSGVEIYLSGEDCREEFLIAGEDLLAATTIARQMSFSKGRFSPLQRVLDCKIWNRFSNQSESSEGHEICLPKLVPYDLIVTSDESGRECLFQSAVRKTLITDLQCRDFGCCVYGIHVRVGSKIHVTERFYEAQELFHTSQYLSRFAYLVAQKIAAMKQRPGRLILVGYETYSELLVLSVENMLREIFRYGEKHPTPNQAIMHIIYENMPGTQPARLRTSIQGPLTKQDNLILLVPINSTLSTHNKVKAVLEKDERFAACAKAGIMKNFGLILIRHGETERLTREEMQYWESVDCNNWTVKAPRLIDPPVDYIVSVRTIWENPLLCKLCYPADCTEERPLIGTNKASVIPTYMIGLTEEHPAENHISHSEEAALPAPLVPFSRKNPRDRTKWFQKLFIPETYWYGHFNYYGNDYQFYFDMELMLGQILQDNFLRKKLDKWLASVHDAIFPNKGGPHPYNIIIAPEQPQNAGWINYVSQRLFRDSSDILHFDVLKEYRDNVKAKFSNITALYNNLIHADESATIHFHFVDSSFCSGRTIARARTLIQSLFPEDAFNGTGNVQIKIFESILVLLNRSSADSQRSQVTNGKFFSFISLKVPNLRNHQDACVLCNLVQEFDNLALRAASNEIAQEWARKAEKLKVQHLEAPRQRVQKTGRSYERAYRRLACSQQAYVWLSELGYRCNQTSDVLDMLWELCYFNQIDTRAIRKYLKKKDLPSGRIWTEIKKNWFEPGACIPDWARVLTAELVDPSKIHKYVNDTGLYIETLISYIKVFSRPFLTFRKSVIEASFRWRLLLLDALLTPERATPAARAALTPVYAYLETGEGPNNYQLLLAFFKALVGGLTKNGSNFVIRSENYGRLLRYYTETLKPLLPEKCREAAEREFLNWYLCNIKRLIDSNGDETKSLWLHHLLLTGEECTRSHLDTVGAAVKKLIPPKGLDRGLAERIYLENNRIIYDGVVDLYENRLDFESPSSPIPYYLENFVSFICSDYGRIHFRRRHKLIAAGDFREVKTAGRVEGTQLR